jgi:acetylornithine deacetylase/succinyl-diaminopimelate desuccinylase-like protein
LKNAAAVATDEEDPFVRDVQGEAVNCGLSIEPIALTYYTDAGLLIPVIKKPFVICGPGEARMAHQIDESVDLNQVAAAARLYTGLMTMYAFRLT